MTARGRKRHTEPWREVLAEAADDTGATKAKPKRAKQPSPEQSVDDALESIRPQGDDAGPDRVIDVDDHGRKYVVEEAPWSPGSDGDDTAREPQRDKPKVEADASKISVRLKSGETSKVEVIEPGQLVERVRIKPPPTDVTCEMVDAGHGFLIDDRGDPPWKTPRRTHCSFCGGEMPQPKPGKQHACEFPDSPWKGCQCSGCIRRGNLARGLERKRGNPPLCCSTDCTRLRKNERDRWTRAVKRAASRGEAPPPEPEDRGQKRMHASIP